MIFIDLSRNIAILLALCTGYTIIFRRWDRQSLSGRIFVGVVFGATAVIGMLTPMTFSPGIIFDGRSILISIAGLFGGGLPAVIAAAIASLFRIAIGGDGVYMGCGVIVSSAAIGVAYRQLRLQNVKEIKTFPLLMFGLVVHIAMLLWTVALPEDIRWQVFQTIALPVLLAYPIGTAIVGRLLANQDAWSSSEKALRASEEKYRMLFDSAGDAIFIHDEEARMLAVNLRACEMLGYTNAELMSMSIGEIDSSEEARQAPDRIAWLMEQGHLAFKTTHQHKDGSLVPIEVNARKIIWQGQPAMMSICRDITERKRAEEALKINEQRLQLAIEGTDLGMWDWDMRTDEVYFNPRYLAMLGYGPTELPHTLKTWENLLHPDDHESVKQQIHICIDKGVGKWNVEFRLKHKNGQYQWISGRGKIVEFSQDGHPIRAAGTHLDITNRKFAEKELRDREERFREVFNNMSSAVAIYDAVEEGNNFTFKDLNRAGLRSSQVELREIVGKKVTEIFPGIMDMGLFDVFQRVYDTGIPEHFPASFYQDSRVTLWVDNYVCKIPSGEIVAVYDDITNRKKSEEELLKVRKLESVGVLAGGIAHDFNNILAAILGNISLALTTIDPKDEIYELLEESEKASLRAKDLTQQLLTFAKGGEPVKKIAAIGEVIKDSAGFVLRGSNVRCDFKFDEELWPVAIDTGQISQVIQNIIVNAGQAMPTGGVIAINCSNYCLESGDIIPLSSGNYVKIVVKDQGIGIPAEMLDNIFDPYFTTKQNGSGLGLAITHSIISKHDGYITVDSEPGRGTTFTIYLPASQNIAELEPKKVTLTPAAGHGRIMIMDDEEMVRSLVERSLSRIGYEVVLAEDGDEAVQLYQSAKAAGAPIDLIIMDLTIPGGMGGKDAVKDIHKIDPEAKAIVSSGYSNDPVMTNFREYGFCGAMVKPFQILELVELVGKAVSN